MTTELNLSFSPIRPQSQTRDIAALKEAIRQLEEQLKEYEGINQALAKEKYAHEETRAMMQYEQDCHQEEIQNRDKKIKALQKEIKELKEERHQVEVELDNLQEELEKLEETNNELEKAKKKLIKSMEEQKQQIVYVEVQVAANQVVPNYKSPTIEELETRDNTLFELAKEAEKLYDENQALKKTLKEYEFGYPSLLQPRLDSGFDDEMDEPLGDITEGEGEVLSKYFSIDEISPSDDDVLEECKRPPISSSEGYSSGSSESSNDLSPADLLEVGEIEIANGAISLIDSQLETKKIDLAATTEVATVIKEVKQKVLNEHEILRKTHSEALKAIDDKSRDAFLESKSTTTTSFLYSFSFWMILIFLFVLSYICAAVQFDFPVLFFVSPEAFPTISEASSSLPM